MGKPQAAVDYLQMAIYALREPLLDGIYHLKLDLALLDLGREKEFIDDLTAKLTLNPPTIDTLFTAAAVELHRGNSAAAAGYLDRARATQEEMNIRLQDYYFRGFSQDKEIGRFFRSVNLGVPFPAAPPTASPSSAGSHGVTPVPSLPPSADTLGKP